MKLVSIKMETVKQAAKRLSSRLIASVLFLGMTTSFATAMADNIHIYEISEGSDSIEVRTFSTEPFEILTDAGYSPAEYEILSEDLRGDQLIGLRIGKKFPVTVFVDGKELICDTASKTVGQFFLQQEIPIGAADIVSPGVDEIVAEGLEIHVTRVNNAVITEHTPIAYETQKRNTKQLSYGTSRVAQAGVEGTLTRQYDVTYHNGVETSRTLISEEITAVSVPEIIEIGTAGAIVTPDGEIRPYKQIVNVEATAYSTEGWRNKHTFTGTRAKIGTVAVDPEVIPLGSELYITSPDGAEWVYGLAVAEDTGSAILGNRIDLFFDTQEECVAFGRADAKVYVLS